MLAKKNIFPTFTPTKSHRHKTGGNGIELAVGVLFRPADVRPAASGLDIKETVFAALCGIVFHMLVGDVDLLHNLFDAALLVKQRSVGHD